jgi:ribosomal protein S19
MNPETKIQRQIMVQMSQSGATVFRNETGSFWTGKVIHKDNRTVTLANASMIPCGLCIGSPDIVGWKSLIVTEDMIGDKIAQFVGTEVKTKNGRPTKEQINFINRLLDAGGIAGVARSPQDAVDLLSRATR